MDELHATLEEFAAEGYTHIEIPISGFGSRFATSKDMLQRDLGVAVTDPARDF